MNITRKKSKNVTTLTFEGELTIYQVLESKEKLFDNYEQLTEQVALDLHNLTEIDTAGIQLLLFARHYFAQLGKSVFIAKSNEMVDALITQLDLATQFSLNAGSEVSNES